MWPWARGALPRGQGHVRSASHPGRDQAFARRGDKEEQRNHEWDHRTRPSRLSARGAPARRARKPGRVLGDRAERRVHITIGGGRRSTRASTGHRHRARSQEPAPPSGLSVRPPKTPVWGSVGRHRTQAVGLASPTKMTGTGQHRLPTQELRHHRGEAVTESEACALAPPRKSRRSGKPDTGHNPQGETQRGRFGAPSARCHRPRHTGYSMALATPQNTRSQR